MSLILASASPRRAELLKQLRIDDFKIIPADIDETVGEGEPGDKYVQRMALNKSRSIRPLCQPDDLLISADTAVCVDNHILGKPENEQAAHQMLTALSGRVHTVLTAVVVSQSEYLGYSLSESMVTFRALTQEEIKHYWLTGEPQDKAGAYAIQGLGAIFVEKLQGSYSGVMGLPLYETAKLLREAKVSLL